MKYFDGVAVQWQEMGRAIGEIRKQRAQWRRYVANLKSRQSLLCRWFAMD